MSRRPYRMKDRAKAQDETRERIVRATMQLHDEHGVAVTSYADIARRAGTGAATVYRHFPTAGDLVVACGAQVWGEMDPPVPERAAQVFDGLAAGEERLQRLAIELDRFYRRGALRLGWAQADRSRVPELDDFLRTVETGVAALVREAVRGEAPPEPVIKRLLALADFAVWRSMWRTEIDDTERCRLLARLFGCAMAMSP